MKNRGKGLMLKTVNKTFRKTAKFSKNLYSNFKKAGKQVTKNISSGISSINFNGVKKQGEQILNTGENIYRNSERKIKKSAWFREMKKGTFIPKRTKAAGKWLSRQSYNFQSSLNQTGKWVNAQAPKVKNFLNTAAGKAQNGYNYLVAKA